MFDRTLSLINQETFNKIQKSQILLIGLGGVGGYALECLVRSGFLHITVVDGDKFEISNLNRQILATQETINFQKVEVAKRRALSINPSCNIKTIDKILTTEDITKEFLTSYDYIIDACDTTKAKVTLMKLCHQYHVKLISSMGTANRLHPEHLSITTLKKTEKDPLAKVLRRELRGDDAINTPVVCSSELPKKQKELGTIASVPMTAGALLISYILTDLEKETISS